MPDALSGIRQAFQAAFGRDVRQIAPTNRAFDQFNGIYVPSEPGVVFVNVASNVDFVTIAGHELWHAIERDRPDPIAWCRSVSAPFYKNLPAYQAEPNKLLRPKEPAYTADKALSELEADFLGDSLADGNFLQALADASPTKFRAFTAKVRDGKALITDSRAVAIAFGKRHRDVLRIVNLMRSSAHPEIAAHAERNFALSGYTDDSGRSLPMFRVTAKGLSELAMGFTGDLSRVIRIRFLDAFEKVAKRLADAEKTITEQLFELERRETPSRNLWRRRPCWRASGKGWQTCAAALLSAMAPKIV